MLKVGIIGFGANGEAHCRCLQKMDEVRVTAIADPVEERLQCAKKQG